MSGETRPRGLSRGAAVAIGLSAAVHVAAGVYLYMARFETHIFTPPDEPHTYVDLYRYEPPPPPPPPEPNRPPELRDVIHPRIPTPADPALLTQVPPLPIAADPTPSLATRELPSLPSGLNEGDGSTTPEPSHVISNPTWLSQPSGAELSRFYPERAARLNLGGHATIHCAVAPNGRLNTCSVVSESPQELGFGNAAVRLSSYFRMRPRMVDGQAVGGEVNIPLTFRVPN